MMRRPTPATAAYAWHRAALRGNASVIHDGYPECGWYRMRMVRGGPWVAVEVCLNREIDPATGELCSPEEVVAIVDGKPRRAESIWTYLEPISREDHADLLARRTALPVMAATHAKLDLSLQPMRP